MTEQNTEHIGDGVYAHWTGYSIEIAVNDHRNEPVVVLEEDVLKRLNEFVERQKQK